MFRGLLPLEFSNPPKSTAYLELGKARKQLKRNMNSHQLRRQTIASFLQKVINWRIFVQKPLAGGRSLKAQN